MYVKQKIALKSYVASVVISSMGLPMLIYESPNLQSFGDIMSIHSRATAIVTAMIVAVGVLTVTPQAANAAYDCTIGHTQQGFA